MTANNGIVQVFQNSAPYFDDTQAEILKDYLQVLFKPGQAVQSRELNQIQSLLTYQLSQIGNFLFENGSPVQGGHITFDNSVLSIQLVSNDNITLSSFADEQIINPVGNVNTLAVVIATDDSVSSNTVEGALIVKYLSANTFADGSQIQISNGSSLATLVSPNATSQAAIASINEGVFYVDGYFVYVPQQTVVLSSLTAFPSCRVGLQINQDIVTSAQDSSLLDPAQGSFNYQAPGADRFQFELILAIRDLSSTDDSQFFELLRVENGVITNQVEYPVLGSIDNQLAQRTYDADGDFTVNPFIVSAIDDTINSNNIILSIGPGKAYVDGYEFQTIAASKMNEPKARSTNTSADYNLSLEFGNYVGVTNVYSGNVVGFNTGNFGQMDVHIVPSGNVNTTNSQAYQNTKIGTTKIRDIEYNGANNWLAYLLDVNLTPIIVNASSLSSNTTSVNLPATFTTSANAIANVTMTVLAGNSSGDVRTIVSYNATSKVGYLNRPTTQLLDTTSQLSLQFGIKDINGFVAAPSNTAAGNVFYTQNAQAGQYPVMDISINGGKDTYGNTVLFSTNFNRLDFPLPQTFVAQNTYANVTYITRLTLTNVAFTSGNATIGTGSGLTSAQQYTFGLTNQYLTNIVAAENFFVVVRNNQTANLANGAVLSWDINGNPGGNGVYQTSSTSVTIKSITTGNFLADVILTVEDTNASVNFRRTKTLVGNTANTVLRVTDSYLNGQNVIGTVNAGSVWVDTTNGFVWFSSYPDITKIPGVRMGMGVPDVTQIIKIYDSGNSSFMPNVTNAIDITSRYSFDSGQRDNYYDHGGLILNPGATPPAGQTVVMLTYYAHSVTNGFFSADSYSASDYANNAIPVYVSPSFPAVNLRDVIDFRPTRTPGYLANIQSFSLTGLSLPQPDDSMVLTYQYYLPRIDKLILTKNRQFDIISGVPSLQPATPPDESGAMTLYVINVPQYTYLAANVTLNYVENKRYTMSDIGALDARISHLEYYVSLNQLEQQATQQTVLYQNGTTAKEQFGIVTDSFVDFSVADTTNQDLLCSINNGRMTAYQGITPLSFVFQSNTGPANENQRTWSLAYTETPVIVQNAASDFTQIQPYAFGQFQGQVAMWPTTDYWYSDSILPQIIGPTVDVPPVTATPPAPKPPAPVVTAPSTNKANLVPATTTTQPKPATPPPPAGAYASAVAGKITYCYPMATWAYTYGNALNFNLAGEFGYGDGIAGVLYYGSPCVILEKTATGWGLLAPNGQWFPVPSKIIQSASALAAQGLLQQYIPSTGSSTVLNTTGLIVG